MHNDSGLNEAACAAVESILVNAGADPNPSLVDDVAAVVETFYRKGCRDGAAAARDDEDPALEEAREDFRTTEALMLETARKLMEYSAPGDPHLHGIIVSAVALYESAAGTKVGGA